MTDKLRYVVALLAAGALTGCAAAGEVGPAAQATRSAQGAPAARTIPFDLLTHCGIDEARIGKTYFEASIPLSDGSGNPPRGWGNPTQHGTMTMTSGTEAVFTDDAGHEVHFRARPAANTFKHLCA
ncbi:hypothetical protein ACIQM0_21670 [Streptomyces sp. NPDC091387]|uniref:hypothetical protein n=1 Tax=Streptomyces sp. NPDC091387 TaxID=3365998 RepID=UPI0038117991